MNSLNNVEAEEMITITIDELPQTPLTPSTPVATAQLQSSCEKRKLLSVVISLVILVTVSCYLLFGNQKKVESLTESTNTFSLNGFGEGPLGKGSPYPNVGGYPIIVGERRGNENVNGTKVDPIIAVIAVSAIIGTVCLVGCLLFKKSRFVMVHLLILTAVGGNIYGFVHFKEVGGAIVFLIIAVVLFLSSVTSCLVTADRVPTRLRLAFPFLDRCAGW